MILLTPDSFREINASDDKVEGLAKGVVEGKDYDLVPALDFGGDAVLCDFFIFLWDWHFSVISESVQYRTINQCRKDLNSFSTLFTC